MTDDVQYYIKYINRAVQSTKNTIYGQTNPIIMVYPCKCCGFFLTNIDIAAFVFKFCNSTLKGQHHERSFKFLCKKYPRITKVHPLINKISFNPLMPKGSSFDKSLLGIKGLKEIVC